VILVDTSVWIDHLRKGDQTLATLLERWKVLMHPMVLGGLACGVLRNRSEILHALANLRHYNLSWRNRPPGRFLLPRLRRPWAAVALPRQPAAPPYEPVR